MKINVEFKKKRLSITGSTNESGGQINSYIRQKTRSSWRLNDGWSDEDVLFILDVWDRWHLNDLRAGTPKQEAFIRQWRKTNIYEYASACEALKYAGLYEDEGFKYGHGWLFEEIPQDILWKLFHLPSPVTFDEDAWEKVISV